MKIGIITFCEAVNYGAFLQAFSLGEFLKENDQDVEYITNINTILQYFLIYLLIISHGAKIYSLNEWTFTYMSLIILNW